MVVAQNLATLHIDFTKNAGIRKHKFTLLRITLITCFANDFGYENWVKEALNFYADENDFAFFYKLKWKFYEYG